MVQEKRRKKFIKGMLLPTAGERGPEAGMFGRKFICNGLNDKRKSIVAFFNQN